MSSSSSSLCAIPQVNVRACIFNEFGAQEDGVVINVKMVQPPPVAGGMFDNKVAQYTSVAGIVLLTNLFQDAWYDIWRGRSTPMRYHVPVTSASQIDIDPILGNDEADPCL